MEPRAQTAFTAGPLARRAVAVVALAVSSFHFAISWWRAGRYGFVDLPIFLTRAQEFLRSGRLYLESVDPVTYAPAAPVYKFPPLFAMLLLPNAHDGVSKGDLVFHWVLQAAVYGAAAGLVLWLFLAGRRGAAWIAGLVLALNFEPYFETVWRLQLETPILLLVALAIAGMRYRAPWLTGSALGVAAMLKIYPGFVLLYFLVRRRWMVLVWATLSMALVMIATLLVIGPPQHRLFFLEILPLLLAEGPLVSTANVSFARHLQELFGMAPMAAKSVQQWLGLGLLAVSSVAIVRQGRQEEGGAADQEGFCLFLVLMLVAMPNSWANYQLMLLPAMILIVRRLTDDSPRRRLLASALAVAYLPLMFYQPCTVASVGWPCAQTPHFLGLIQLPRGFHDVLVDMRAISAPLIWGVLFLLAWSRRAASVPAEA